MRAECAHGGRRRTGVQAAAHCWGAHAESDQHCVPRRSRSPLLQARATGQPAVAQRRALFPCATRARACQGGWILPDVAAAPSLPAPLCTGEYARQQAKELAKVKAGGLYTKQTSSVSNYDRASRPCTARAPHARRTPTARAPRAHQRTSLHLHLHLHPHLHLHLRAGDPGHGEGGSEARAE